jgi:hypothetical protein
MDLANFQELLSQHGQRAIAVAEVLQPTEAAFLACFDKLRKEFPPELAKAALETTLLRRKARDKFTHAHAMYFTRESLEQATSETVADYRVRRFAGHGTVADLCCGIGGDALAFARAGHRAEAVDTDAVRIAMTQANAGALGFAEHVQTVHGDALRVPLTGTAAFADPNRRSDNRRFLAPEDYTPPLSAIRARFAPEFPLAVKIAPGVARSDIPPDAEAEFISLRGEMKECVLWFGSLRTATTRATLLPSGATLAGESQQNSRPLETIGAVLYDPDPAITRAGLVSALAEQLDAFPVDYEVQLLTANQHTLTPFATAFAVELAAPFHAKKLRAHLREHRVGRVTVIKRGSPADADTVLRQLKLEGPNHRIVFLARTGGVHTMIVCAQIM